MAAWKPTPTNEHANKRMEEETDMASDMRGDSARQHEINVGLLFTRILEAQLNLRGQDWKTLGIMLTAIPFAISVYVVRQARAPTATAGSHGSEHCRRGAAVPTGAQLPVSPRAVRAV